MVPPTPQSLGGGVPGGYRREALSAESKKVLDHYMVMMMVENYNYILYIT